MTKTALNLTPQQWQSYQVYPKNNKPQEQERWEHAWQLVYILANQLRGKFNATKVVVFGSLLHLNEFHSDSDIDLGTWGIPPEQFYQAVAMVTGFTDQFAVDLVDLADCLPQLKQVMESEGISV